mgnify:CR=1 FL=1
MNLLDKKKCEQLLEKIYELKNYNENDLFLSEKEFLKDPSFKKKTNPGNDVNNILLDKSLALDFIFKNKKIDEIISKILGKNYNICLSKIVMGIPDHRVPEWIKKILSSLGSSNNLNGFLKEKFRDVTCYYGAEYHQDSIDYSGSKTLKSKTFIVMYIYLSDVLETDAPIYILPTSHIYGAQQFPHEIEYNKNEIFYSPDNKKKVSLDEVKLTGDAGTVFFWHSLLLHKTTIVKNSKPRISLKVVIEKNLKDEGLIDNIDKKILDKLVLENPLKNDWRNKTLNSANQE